MKTGKSHHSVISLEGSPINTIKSPIFEHACSSRLVVVNSEAGEECPIKDQPDGGNGVWDVVRYGITMPASGEPRPVKPAKLAVSWHKMCGLVT